MRSFSLEVNVRAESDLREHGHRFSLRLERRVLDVAEVLAVGMERQRDVTGDLDPVEIMPSEEALSRGVSAEPCTTFEGTESGLTSTVATKSSPCSNAAPRAIGRGSRPA